MTKATFGWAHVRTHPKHACFFNKGHVVMVDNQWPCRVVSAKTVINDQESVVSRSIHVVNVLSGKHLTITEPANAVLQECRVLKEEFEVHDQEGNVTTVCAMPVVELRERPQSLGSLASPRKRRKSNDGFGRAADGGGLKASPLVAGNNNEANCRRALREQAQSSVPKSGKLDATKHRVVYKTTLWRPFESAATILN